LFTISPTEIINKVVDPSRVTVGALIPIHAIGIGSSHNPIILKQISEHTKGSYNFVREPEELSQVMQRLMADFSYVISLESKITVASHDDRIFEVIETPVPFIGSPKQLQFQIPALCANERKTFLVEVKKVKPSLKYYPVSVDVKILTLSEGERVRNYFV
jgi:hypothetical protein